MTVYIVFVGIGMGNEFDLYGVYKNEEEAKKIAASIKGWVDSYEVQ